MWRNRPRAYESRARVQDVGAWAYLAALDVHRFRISGRCERNRQFRPPRRPDHEIPPPLPRPQGLLDREQRHLPPRSRVCSSERGTAVGVGQIRGETEPQLALRRGRTNSLLRLDDTSRRKTTSAGEKRLFRSRYCRRVAYEVRCMALRCATPQVARKCLTHGWQEPSRRGITARPCSSGYFDPADSFLTRARNFRRRRIDRPLGRLRPVSHAQTVLYASPRLSATSERASLILRRRAVSS